MRLVIALACLPRAVLATPATEPQPAPVEVAVRGGASWFSWVTAGEGGDASPTAGWFTDVEVDRRLGDRYSAGVFGSYASMTDNGSFMDFGLNTYAYHDRFAAIGARAQVTWNGPFFGVGLGWEEHRESGVWDQYSTSGNPQDGLGGRIVSWNSGLLVDLHAGYTFPRIEGCCAIEAFGVVARGSEADAQDGIYSLRLALGVRF